MVVEILGDTNLKDEEIIKRHSKDFSIALVRSGFFKGSIPTSASVEDSHLSKHKYIEDFQMQIGTQSDFPEAPVFLALFCSSTDIHILKMLALNLYLQLEVSVIFIISRKRYTAY